MVNVYPPTEDDVSGMRKGDRVEIACQDDVTIVVQQYDSGIGASWRVTVRHPQYTGKVHLFTFVDDDGLFHVGCSGV